MFFYIYIYIEAFDFGSSRSPLTKFTSEWTIILGDRRSRYLEICWWWFQLIQFQRYCASETGSFPHKIGVKMQNLWNHHLVYVGNWIDSQLKSSSCYGLFTYVWAILMVNVGKSTIHLASGIFPRSKLWQLQNARSNLPDEQTWNRREFLLAEGVGQRGFPSSSEKSMVVCSNVILTLQDELSYYSYKWSDIDGPYAENKWVIGVITLLL